MTRQIITGIDVGSLNIKIAVAEHTDSGLNILCAVQKPSEGIKHGFVTNLDEAIRSIKNAVKTAEKLSGIPLHGATIAVNGIGLASVKSKGSIMISRADGEITGHDIKRVLDQSEANAANMANRRVIKTSPLYFKVDGTVTPGRPVGFKGAKLDTETVSITCLNQHVSDLIKAIEASGISIEDIVASPIATGYAVLSREQKDVGCVMTDIGASSMSVSVFENNSLVSLETFPIGSSHITNDIALGFQISLAEAEKLKKDFGSDISVSKRRLSDIIEARLNDIFELIELHLKKTGKSEMLPGGIVLTGGGSELSSLEEIAKNYLHLPAKIGTVKTNLTTNITAPSNIKDQLLGDPGWSTAIGLCIMNASEDQERLTDGTGILTSIWRAIKKGLAALVP